MSYEFYKILHFIGHLIAFGSLFTLIGVAWSDSTSPHLAAIKKRLALGHGLGLLVILVSGFGLAAKLGFLSQFPTWLYLKIGIWLVVGGLIAVVKRRVLPATGTLFLILLIALFGSIVAVTKPF